MALRFGVGCKFTDSSTKWARADGGEPYDTGVPMWPGKVFQAAEIESHMGDTSIRDTEGRLHYNIFKCTVVEEAPPGYALRLEVNNAVDHLVRRYGVAAVREALNRHDT